MRNWGKRKKEGLTAGTFSGNHVPKSTRLIYSLSGVFRDACTVLVSGFFLTYAKTSGLLGSGDQYLQQLGAISLIFALLLIWDGFNDPIMSLIVERCHFKSGKYRPWILLGAIGTSVMVLLMFLLEPKGWGFVVCFGIYYFLWDFVFTMNDIAYWAMLPSLTNEEGERKKLTALVSIAAMIGNIGMNVLVVLLQGDGSKNYTLFGYIAIPTTILFLLSQAFVYFFCKEHDRDLVQEGISSKTKLWDLFKVFKDSKPLRMVVISLLFYYLLGNIAMGFGYDYFYITYGSIKLGGAVVIWFLAFYALGALFSQILYPTIAKRFSYRVIMRAGFCICLISFALFFVLGVPLFGEKPLAYSEPSYFWNTSLLNPFSGTGWLIFIPTFFFSMALGIMYLVELVLLQDTIDYNEWKFGERKETVAFAWRPLDAKLAGALEKGIYALAIAASGVYLALDSVNSANQQREAGLIDESEASALISNALTNLPNESKIAFMVWFIGSIVICVLIQYFTIRFGYKISEKEYDEIRKELEKRHQEDYFVAKKTVKQETDSPSTNEFL